MNGLELPFRQIHLDFHTSSLIEGVGRNFDADQFADTLLRASVNSVTCFARCHHGMLYYDSKKHPERIHPHLIHRNLLSEQIEACHRRGIRVPVYTTVQWDQFTVDQHPEWVTINEHGARTQSVLRPGFYTSLCVNSPYRNFLKEHVGEILQQLSVDGLFLDILFPVECVCGDCRRLMMHQGLEPSNRADRQQFARYTLREFTADMSQFIRSIHPTCNIFYNSSHVGPGHRERISAYTHLELESLPSGDGWGYMHFPVAARYARTLGLEVVGQTGKFHTEWGDLHSFKNREALQFECYRMLALGAKCMIGDQLDPEGVLQEEVYELIGQVYADIERKEPWCREVDPLADIGLLTPEQFKGGGREGLPASLLGAVRMLQEGGHQFDIVDTASDLERYSVLILPDCIPVNPTSADLLGRYLDKGGKLIATFESGLDEGAEQFAMKEWGVRLKSNPLQDADGQLVRGVYDAHHSYAEYVLPKGDMARGLHETEYVMYMKGTEVEPVADACTMVDTIRPLFYRSYKHFHSHRQAPSSGVVDGPAVTRCGNVVYFAHPVFTMYHLKAPKWCKILLLNALDELLPDPYVRHHGPSTVQAALNRQSAANRWVLHLLHYIPERRSHHIEIIEDVIPIHQLPVSVKAEATVTAIRLVPQMESIAFEQREGRVEFTIPSVVGHQMVEIAFQ